VEVVSVARTVVVERVSRSYRAFRDRADAGRALVRIIAPDSDPAAVVLSLPRGGVPVARPLADALGVRVVPMPVRKLPIPDSPEMGFGAVTLDGTLVLNERVVAGYEIDELTAARVAEDVRHEVERRSRLYPGGFPFPEVEGRSVWVVDDGLATGYTMLAAARMICARRPARLSMAVPVAAPGALELVTPLLDAAYCLIEQRSSPFAVASFYRDFHDLSDDEVVSLLELS
jgi:putative phosphoribosyl transferase